MQPLLQIESLVRSYAPPGGRAVPVVKIDRFELAPAEQLALSGESGSGKTTFLNLIAGITSPDAGRILFDGRDVTALAASERDKLRAVGIGTIFQSFNLLQGYSSIENIELAMMLGRGVDRPFAEALLQRVGLADHRNHRPGQLSIGQQQRVAIARSLANRPRIILADEPTGNLDRRNAETAIELIRSLCTEERAALIVVSHDRQLLSGFDRVIDFDQLNQARAKFGGSAGSSAAQTAEGG